MTTTMTIDALRATPDYAPSDETLALEAEVRTAAMQRGISTLELARELSGISDSPVRCGQLDSIIRRLSSEAEEHAQARLATLAREQAVRDAEAAAPPWRASRSAHALVWLADGRPWREVPLSRLGYGLWPDGFAGTVVGLIIDSGTGTTDTEIRAALTVTVLDPDMGHHIARAVDDYVACEIERVRDDAERAAE